MPKPRYSQVALSATPYYHCVSRCVRRAFLCGADTITGQSFEHRRQWIEDKILALSRIFALDVCAYAVMSNHYHVVLHVNYKAAQSWSMDNVIQHWHQLFSGHALSQRYVNGEHLGLAERSTLNAIADTWRLRLMDISWFMRVLNESIARQANNEDECTGRFWEGRFKSQALLDEAALLACMAYVDLNPVRAGIALTPEVSAHTSIQRRITIPHQSATGLFPFVGNPRQNLPEGLQFNQSDYVELVDWTGRIIRPNKKSAIAAQLPPILQRLQQNKDNWLYLTQNFESKFKGFVGAAHKLKQICASLGYQRCAGLRTCSNYFS
jgi:REP element-mobilizing transposase RayT